MGGIECIINHVVLDGGNETFDLELEYFGVNISEIHDTSICPKIIRNCWLEDWERTYIEDKRATVKYRLLDKCGKVVFTDNTAGNT